MGVLEKVNFAEARNWVGLVCSVAALTISIRGCSTAEHSSQVSREFEFRQYVYEAADLLGARATASQALDFEFQFKRDLRIASMPATIEKSQLEKARRILEKAEILKPNDADLHVLRAIYFVGFGDAEHFMRELSKLAEEDKMLDDVAIYVSGAMLAGTTVEGQSLADRLYRKALIVSPLDARIVAIYGVFLHETNRNSESLVELRDALRLEPLKPQYYNALAHVFAESNDPVNAIATIRKAFDNNIQHPELHNTLGVSYFAVGKKDLALLEFRAAIGMFEPEGLYHHNLAIVLRSMKKVKEANSEEMRATELGFKPFVGGEKALIQRI